MPRKGNPGDIKTGPGAPVPEEGGDLVLIGPGNPPSPNIGEVGYIPPGGDLAHARHGIPPDMKTGSGGSDLELQAHIHAVHGAHPASAITYDPYPAVIRSRDVEGALDELQGAIPAEPPRIGQTNPQLNAGTIGIDAITGIPDWGWLKLVDSAIKDRDENLWDLPNMANPASEVYPYFLVPPSPALDQPFPFTYPGSDPATDGKFNTGINQDDMAQYAIGSGPGKTHAGGFTRTVINDNDVIHTLRLSPTLMISNPPIRTWGVACVSGMLYPSDRGVLALLHFPPDDNHDPIANFTEQHLLDRCVAAILLGQGLEEGASIGSSIGDMCLTGSIGGYLPVDGDPGGIFDVGFDAYGHYDPFSFPGRASGQFDLREIHMGQNIFGQPLPPPWNDFDGDTVPGARRVEGSNIPAPGQVRLGSDPAAGETPLPFGIPILGAGIDSYAPSGGSPWPLDGHLPGPSPMIDLFTAIGNSIVPQYGVFPPTPISGLPVNWSVEPNFFRYRLPYLDDYTYSTGLKYTPRGPDPIRTSETYRYFIGAFPLGAPTGENPWKWEGQSLGVGGGSGGPQNWEDVLDVVGLPQAGNYTNFKQDYWHWQIARYRHSFILKPSNTTLPPTPGAPLPGPVFEVGSYWLVHFRTEHSFEQFVRFGDAIAATDVYGAHMVDLPPQETSNIVNEETGTYPTVLPPEGPAPDMGYAAFPYHQLRSNVQFSDRTLHEVEGYNGDFDALHWDWQTNPILAGGGVNFAVTVISGVAYLMPRMWIASGSDPLDCFQITALDVDLAPFYDLAHPFDVLRGPWEGSYRTEDAQLSGDPPVNPPALLSSPNPAFIGLSAFTYGLHTDGTDTFDQPSTWETLNPLGDRRQRVEFPLTFFANGGGQYDTPSGSNAPLTGDDLVIGIPAQEWLQPTGDPLNPAFTHDHQPRVFIRRPLAHDTWETSSQPPFNNTIQGHGVELHTDANKRQVLFHSTGFYADFSGPPAPVWPENGYHGRFGNFYVPMFNGGPFYFTWLALFDTEKDTYERFLDETYRYTWTFNGLGSEPDYWSSLVGPGLPLPPADPHIKVPVRAGMFPNEANNTPINPDATQWNPPSPIAPTCWQNSSWIQTGLFLRHLSDPYSFTDMELQVAGWPKRNPGVADWVDAPFASTGLLKNPNINYSDTSAYRPSQSLDTLWQAQPDYSSLPSAPVDYRAYVRCFDTAFSWANRTTPFDQLHQYNDPVGNRNIILRVDGLRQSDFASPHTFSVGGPSAPASSPTGSKIAVLVKIPGITTWMDVSIADGSGPSKASTDSDGAGCMISFTEKVDPVTKLVYTLITLDTKDDSPFDLFHGQEHVVNGNHVFEVPLLVKVLMDATMTDGTYDLQQDVTAMLSIPYPAASPTNIRGLVGIRVLHPNDLLTM